MIRHIHAGWLIDGSGEPVRKDVLLTIADGRFTEIGTLDRDNPPPAQLLTDLGHCTLLPPLVDCHVHLTLSGTTDPDTRAKQRAADYESSLPLIVRHLSQAFAHGVLAVRDAADAHGHVLSYLRENEKRAIVPVLVKSTGRAWHQLGRYGGMLGRHPEPGENLAEAYARDPDPGDQVKVINSGPNSLRDFARETPAQFDAESLRQLVRLANEQGKKVMVHANGELPVRIALQAGCQSIEHGYFMGRENLARMAGNGIAWVPTLVPIKACADQLEKESRDIELAVTRRTLDHQLEQLALARELGVTIALGTDAGSMGVHHGQAVGVELCLLLKAGLTLPQAIRAAAWNGARLLGVEDTIGMIARHRPANFLALNCTPSQLPETLSCLEAISLNGRFYPKEFFRNA